MLASLTPNSRLAIKLLRRLKLKLLTLRPRDNRRLMPSPSMQRKRWPLPKLIPPKPRRCCRIKTQIRLPENNKFNCAWKNCVLPLEVGVEKILVVILFAQIMLALTYWIINS
jgi:hypothetical protein